MTAQMEGAGVDLGALEEGNVEEALAAEAEAEAPAEAPAEEAAEG
jgi:small subunit ribosomal protein S2